MWELESFQTAKEIFSDIQGNWYALVLMHINQSTKFEVL